MSEKQLKVTSPEEYAALVERESAADIGELVPLPSGMVVRARRADMEGLALVGSLPMSLANAAAESLRKRGKLEEGEEEERPAEMSEAEIEEGQKGLIFIRETVRKNALEPRIVYDESGAVAWEWPNGARKEVLAGDFKYLFHWMSGEEGADGLDSFRNRRERRAAAAQSRRKVLPRKEPVPAAAGK